MRLTKKMIAFVACAALASTSTAAVAAGSPLDARPLTQVSTPQPAGEAVDGDSLAKRNYLLLLLALIAAGFGAWQIFKKDHPASPGGHR